MGSDSRTYSDTSIAQKRGFQSESYAKMYITVSKSLADESPAMVSLYGAARENSGFSVEAGLARDGARTALRAVAGSEHLLGRRAKAIAELSALAKECSETGWDGESAAPVSVPSFRNACDFVWALPDSLPIPEFAAEPDGAISLDWIRGPYLLLSVSIGPSQRLAWAWLDGSDSGHGVLRFDGASIPDRLLDEIRRVTSDGGAPVRSA
jgi:hypothetical protein